MERYIVDYVSFKVGNPGSWVREISKKELVQLLRDDMLTVRSAKRVRHQYRKKE